MEKYLTVSPSPHLYGKKSVESLMYGVILALIPALAVSIYYFGMGAAIVTCISILSCLLFEFLIQIIFLKTKPTISDGSAIVTGLLLAFNVPSNLHPGILVIGSFVAIAIGKMSFGGLGKNPFNPALVGRVFLLISFPVQMTSWPLPINARFSYINATTGATPLGALKNELANGIRTVSEILEQGISLGDDKIYHFPNYIEQLIGQMGGSLGEISAAALILGGLYLLLRKIIHWHIPVSILLSVLLFTALLHYANPLLYAPPLFHLLTGGLLLGAIFMATDYVTSPMTARGMWIFGIGIGVITVLIRVFGAYPEGVSFAILIMNAFVPLINRYSKPKRFGEKIKEQT